MVDPVLTVVKKLPTANKHYKMVYSKILLTINTPLSALVDHIYQSVYSVTDNRMTKCQLLWCKVLHMVQRSPDAWIPINIYISMCNNILGYTNLWCSISHGTQWQHTSISDQLMWFNV